MTKFIVVLLVPLLAVACVQTSPPGPTPPGSTAVARLEVKPGALMFTRAGETRVLSVKAFNTSGAPVPATVSWTSSKPSAVSVDASGTLTAVGAVGSSQVTAVSGAVVSPPVLVTIVQPAPGAVLVADDQVVSAPTPVDASATPDPSNEYEVVLRGLEPPAPGTVLLGTGASSIGGKVVSSQTVADGIKVRLKLAPVNEMVSRASFDEVLSFRGAPLTLPKEIADAYTVTQRGDEYTLTPKPATSARSRLRPLGGPQGTSVFTALPFNECTVNTPTLPITLAALPTLSIKIDPTYELKTDEFGALERLVFKAAPSVKATIPFVINADATLSLECTSALYSKLIPLPGWLGLILAGELEAGIGFELAGKVTLFNAGVELSSETSANVELGMECAFGECNMVKKLETVKNDNKVSWRVPNLGQLRVEPSLFGYGYVKAKLGATLLKTLRIEALGAKAGVKYEASLAPAAVQVQPTPPPDPDYQSSYKVSALLEVSAGKRINNLLTNLGIAKFNALKFTSSLPLGQSPKAVGSNVDRDSFSPGDTLNFAVTLAPNTVKLPFLGYNVARVVIYRDRLGTIEEIAGADATPDQTSFTIPWTANIGSAGGGTKFYAFVRTALPSVVDLELGRVVAVPAIVAGSTVYAGTFSLNATQTHTASTSQSSLDASEVLAAEGTVENSATNQNLRFQGAPQITNTRRSDSRSFNVPGTTNLCGYTEEGQTLETNALTGLDTAASSLALRASDTEFRLNVSATSFKGTFTFTRAESTTGAYRSGVCKDGEIPSSSSTNSGSFVSTFGFNLPELRGSVTRDANGNKVIVGSASGTVDIPVSFPPNAKKSIQYTLALNLKERVASSSAADLELGLIAPATATPEGKLTYAVNLRNKSANTASNVRAAFFLPEGFTVLSTAGWSGCSTILTTVTCTLSSLAGNNRRAFLIDVQAPASSGEYTVGAQVFATESDPNPEDNFALGLTTITAP
jgi:uncharacterized repeat protein (TIGR01451 family)